MNENATLLFAAPSFLRGAARALDIGGTLNVYNDSQNSKEADQRALQSDWEAVGFALSEAMDGFGYVE